MKNKHTILFSLNILLSLAMLETHAASNIDPANKHAWSTNAGWIDFRPTHGGVTVYPDHLEGYAWAENFGWIQLGSHNAGGAHTYANTSHTNWGINNDGAGKLSGYAWSTHVGWINFNSSQITINQTTGDFDGDAWSENIGWIRFNGSPTYKVKVENQQPNSAGSFYHQSQSRQWPGTAHRDLGCQWLF
jgi:hypothetical protein